MILAGRRGRVRSRKLRRTALACGASPRSPTPCRNAARPPTLATVRSQVSPPIGIGQADWRQPAKTAPFGQRLGNPIGARCAAVGLGIGGKRGLGVRRGIECDVRGAHDGGSIAGATVRETDWPVGPWQAPPCSLGPAHRRARAGSSRGCPIRLESFPPIRGNPDTLGKRAIQSHE